MLPILYRFLACLVVLPGILASGAFPTHAQLRAAESAVVEGVFRDAVSLWANERFESLWEQGDSATRRSVSKERFVLKMRDRALKPACCFRQVQEVTVTLRTQEDAFVRAKIGFDSRTRGTTFDTTLTFSLRKEEGEWRVAVEDFIRLPDETVHRLFPVPPRSNSH